MRLPSKPLAQSRGAPMTDEIIGPANTIDKPEDTGSTSSERRERSTIKFPYGDLETAIGLASILHEHAGVRCEVARSGP